ncbi:MAG: alpha-ketoglutarate-dependent dioxygenase AlkB [Polyangiaceae bacterium]|nr:alpha-ketoglutarate-dependent dioxygenase AlkB [Polyangiaceae bacterium]
MSLVPSILLREDFLPNHAQLFAVLVSSVQWDERIHVRKTASFGVSYNYSGFTYPEVPMLPALLPICQALQLQLGFLPNNCLLNYYPDGNAAMGYHSDSSTELVAGTGVAVISLGAERMISYRYKADRTVVVTYPLKPGALLYMSKEVQDTWQHAIPKMPGAGSRISLTFRQIA